MSETRNPFIGTRDTVADGTEDRQDRNRQWWERMPMTYADWHADDRLPTGIGELGAIERKLLDGSPYLSERYDFGALEGLRAASSLGKSATPRVSPRARRTARSTTLRSSRMFPGQV